MNSFHFSAPGNYEIKIEGQLRSDWHARLGAMQVVYASPEMEDGITVLQGCVNDQAELSGILNTIYELHLTLLSVQYMNGD